MNAVKLIVAKAKDFKLTLENGKRGCRVGPPDVFGLWIVLRSLEIDANVYLGATCFPYNVERRIASSVICAI